jgi:hypothetical protein
MSLATAMSKVKKLPSEIQVALSEKHGHLVRPHKQHGALVQAKQDPSYGGALQKAKDTLNNMMEETEHELDTAVLECKEFDEHTVAILDENTMLRAGLGEQVAVARSEIAEADAMIAQAKTELETIRISAEAAAAQCEVSINTQKAALEILNADLAISEKVENMTQCDESTSMLQCGSGYAARFHFAGESAAPLQNFKSKAAMLARERAARMALKKPLNQFAYKKHHIKKHHLNLASGKKNLGKRALKQPEPEVAPEAEGVNKTTEASDDVLESIENLTVAAMPEPVSYDPNDHIGKCSVSGSPMCPMLRDALSQLTAEIRWARDIAAQGLAETEAECKRLAEDYKRQSDEWEGILQENNVKFSTATGNLNTAEEAIRLKVDEANALIEELTQHRADCAEKIKDGAEALCGIKTIRQELFQIQGENPLIVDC